jgi:drug/metabolite transporter (DMT)-like permease
MLNKLPINRGLLLILLSSFFIGWIAVFAKIASQSVSPSEILCFRALFGLLVTAFFVPLFYKEFKATNLRVLIIRGLSGGIATLSYFIAVSKIDPAIATLLNNTYPIFIALFSILLLKESISYPVLISFLISFAGIFIIVNPASIELNSGYIWGLLSAIFAAVAVLSITRLRRTDSTWIIFTAFNLGNLVFALPGSVANFTPLNSYLFWLLLLVALFSMFSQLLLTYAYKFIKADQGSIVSMSSTLFTFIFSIVMFNTLPTFSEILGAILILGASGYLISKGQPCT